MAVGTKDEQEGELSTQIRQQAAHDLMSPARGVSIAVDLLAEVLESPVPDMDLIRTLSRQLATSSDDLLARLSLFAEGRSA